MVVKAQALVVALAASVAAFRTKNPGWLAGLATMVTLILWVLDKRRGATLANRQVLDKVHEELRAAVLRQWSSEVAETTVENEASGQGRYSARPRANSKSATSRIGSGSTPEISLAG